jgi:glutaminyl-tRNA synthetase
VKGTIHWANCNECEKIECHILDRLFTEEQMGAIPEGVDYKTYLNPESLVVKTAYAEPDLLKDNSGIAVQFERTGYFYKDPKNGAYNKATGLKDSFKIN